MSHGARVAVALTILALWAAPLVGWLFEVRGPMLVCIAAAFLPYALMMALVRSGSSLATVLACVGLASLPLVFSDALLSEDVFRHLFEGRVVLAGENPFSRPPLDPALTHLRGETWAKINHKSIATVYPVLLQGIFALLAALNSVLVFKVFALAVHLLTVRALFHHGRARAAWLFGLNPLLLVEGPLSGHHDGLLGLLLLFAVLGLQRQRRFGIALAAVAASLKLVGFAALAAFAPKHRVAVAIAVLLSVAFVVPSFVLAGERVSGTTHFAHRWQGNEGAYVLIERGVASLFVTLGVPQQVRYEPPAVLPEFADPTATFEDVFRGAVWRSDLVRFTARLVALLGVLLFALWAGRRFAPGRALLLVLWLSLLLSPQLHPWYWMWLLPLACYLSRPGALLAAPLLLVAYGSLDAWQLARASGASMGWVHLVLWLVFLCELPTIWLFVHRTGRNHDSAA